MRRRFIIGLMALVALSAGPGVSSHPLTPRPPLPQPTVIRWPDDRALTIDPAFAIGKLPNGLTFYVRRHELPAKRVVLRLIVKTGSLHEADDQRGYAHFVEHMAFNGTRHFKPGQLLKFFEERGARFGAHVNAVTSYESTIYLFTIPSDKPELLDKGLLALADFAGGISFDRREVDAERPIVVEEWRQGQGVGARTDAKQRPVLYRGSRYVDRLPIGTRESVDAATPAQLRRFYDTWYRPDRMAVVVVGDVEAARAQALLRKHFASLKGRAPAGTEPDAGVPLHAELLTSVVTDPEITSSSATVLRKRQASSRPDVATIRRARLRGLASGMLNTRLAEITRRTDAPFLGASFMAIGLGTSAEAWGFSVRTRDGELAKGLEAALVEGTRVRDHGFVAAELDRVKQSIRAGIESGYKERDKVESGSLAGACVSHFLDDQVPMTPDDSRDLALDLLDRVTLDEIAREARTLLDGSASVMLTTTPEKKDLAPPAEPELRNAIARAESAKVTAWEDVAVTRDLMETKPEPVRATSSRTIPELGVTVLTFANGIEAWLKPTDFRNEQIAFSLQGIGGSAQAPRELFVESTLATRYVSAAGVGGLTPPQLGRVLAGKLGGASPFIGPTTTGVSGGATPEFLETALQLLHLSVTAPNDDPAALALLKRQLIASLTNRSQNPGAVFNDRLNGINFMKHYTTEVPDAPRIERVEIAPMLAFYRERFARARDVRFVMVGAFDLATVTPLLERYVGSLTMGAERERAGEAAPLDVRFASSIVKERVVKGRERAARTVITFPIEVTRDLEKLTPQGAALGVLQVRLRERLREQLGQTYSVSVSRGPSLMPFSTLNTVTISFGSAAENVDGLTDAVLREIDQLRREGPTEAEVRTWQEQEQRSLETGQKQNRYWMSGIVGAHLLGHDPLTILDRGKRVAALTRPPVHEAIKALFPADRYTVVSLVPEP